MAALRIVGSYSHDAGWIDRVVIAPGEFPPANPAPRAATCSRRPSRPSITTSTMSSAPRCASARFQAHRRAYHHAVLLLSEAARGRPALHRQRSRARTRITSRSMFPRTTRDEFQLGALNIKYTTPVLEFSSTTSYWSRHEPLIQDTSESWTTGLGLGGSSTGTAGQGRHRRGVRDRGQPDASDHRGAARVLGGRRAISSGWSATSTRTSIRPGTSFSRRRTARRSIGSNNLFSYFSPLQILQQSVFGEVTYNVTEPFAITVGARRYHYDAPVSIDQFGALTRDGRDLDLGEGPGRHAQGLALL